MMMQEVDDDDEGEMSPADCAEGGELSAGFRGGGGGGGGGSGSSKVQEVVEGDQRLVRLCVTQLAYSTCVNDFYTLDPRP